MRRIPFANSRIPRMLVAVSERQMSKWLQRAKEFGLNPSEPVKTRHPFDVDKHVWQSEVVATGPELQWLKGESDFKPQSPHRLPWRS